MSSFSPAPLLLILFTLLCLITPPAAGAPQLPPPAGRWVLIIPPSDATAAVTFREYPGVRRMENLAGTLTELPSLSPAVSAPRGGLVLALLSLREGYARVTLSPSGQTGWIKVRPGWQIAPWERFLPGRTVRLRGGVRDAARQLHRTPAEAGEVTGSVPAGSPLAAAEVRDDWLLVRCGGAVTGWLRWRNGDGRLLVTVE